MTTYSYFTLTTMNRGASGPTTTKKFRVVDGGYAPYLEKAENMDVTVEGKLDISQGAVHKAYDFIVKVYQEDPSGDSSYATYADLETFFRYNKPLGSPSNMFYMTDHYGEHSYVKFGGQLKQQPATVFLEGKNAIYFIQISLKVLDQVDI
jgi:hypothetical protein